MTREFMCPACGKKLFSFEQGTRKYGYMIRECKKCKNKYIDPRYHEMAIEGIPNDVFRIPPYIGIIVIGALLIWRAIYLFGIRQLGTRTACNGYCRDCFGSWALLLSLVQYLR